MTKLVRGRLACDREGVTERTCFELTDLHGCRGGEDAEKGKDVSQSGEGHGIGEVGLTRRLVA